MVRAAVVTGRTARRWLVAAALAALGSLACSLEVEMPSNLRCSEDDECRSFGAICGVEPSNLAPHCCRGAQCGRPDAAAGEPGSDGAFSEDAAPDAPADAPALEAATPRDAGPDVRPGAGGLQLAGTTPPSPSFVPNPQARGTAPPGTSIGVHLGQTCAGSPVATGTADASGAFAVAVPVPPNASSMIRVGAQLGPSFHCSSPVTYVHDDVPPAIDRVEPPAESTDVLRTDPVVVWLSEPIDPAAAGKIAFAFQDGSQALPGRIEVAGRTVTFTPAARLPANTTLSVSVKEIVDPAGNRLPGARAWAFTTGRVGWSALKPLPTLAPVGVIRTFLTVNARGEGGAFWSSGSPGGTPLGKVWWNRLHPGGRWDAAEVVQGDDGSEAAVEAVAIDEAGHLTVGWGQARPGTGDGSFWARRFTAGMGWGTAQELGPPGGSMQIATGPVASIAAVESMCETAFHRARAVEGGKWAPETLKDREPGCDRFQVGANAAGNILVVTSTKRNPTKGDLLTARWLDASGTWSAPATLQDQSERTAWVERIAFGLDGEVVVAWARTRESNEPISETELSLVTARHAPATGWEPARVAVSGLDQLQSFAVATAGAGKAVLVWAGSPDRGPFAVYAAELESPGGWSAPRRLDPLGKGDALVTGVVMDGSGRAVATWQGSDARNQGPTFLSRYGAAKIWSPPYPVDTDSPAVAVAGPAAMATDGSGMVTLVFPGPNGPRWMNLE